MRKLLGALQIFIGVGGAAGGLGMVMDPTGAGVMMDTAWLADSPFDDFLIPGLFLLLVNGVANLVAGPRTLLRRRYFAETAIVLGVFLMCWIVAQVYWIGLVHWMQPVYFGFGVMEAALGTRWRRTAA